MKLKTLTLSGLLALATVHPAHADEWLKTQQGATFLGATAAGVALGGPLGMLGGALLGAWYNDALEDSADIGEVRDELAQSQLELDQSETRLVQVKTRLNEAQQSNLQYAQLVMDQLQLEMLFKTDATELTPAGHMRLATLASFLVENPEIAIRLDGYADPRGDAAYNQQLSVGRVNHVAQALREAGVDEMRIESFSHGADQSQAPQGDYDAYALERAVKINLSQPSANDNAVAIK